MHSNIFITGTDTDIGKTLVAGALLSYLNKQGHKTLAFKPVSSGCAKTINGLRNRDALELAAMANLKTPYSETNPFAFEAAIAPHIAAMQLKQTITTKNIIQRYQALEVYAADNIVIEGAGGWRVPLNATEYISDFVKVLNIPVILVVGLRLGCINHALLTWEMLQKQGIHLLGWVANTLDPNMLAIQENIACLAEVITAPLLGTLPYDANIDFAKAESYLNFNWLNNSAASDQDCFLI